ncbi:MAG: hypothetical protein ACF8CQ_01735 [Rhodopirellula sp. JB044]|uniref:hypothetical protein n=1 Tax=Rhodopirellula sp. JB044 TaxID=3342844 RepID=UPI00370B4EBB
MSSLLQYIANGPGEHSRELAVGSNTVGPSARGVMGSRKWGHQPELQRANLAHPPVLATALVRRLSTVTDHCENALSSLPSSVSKIAFAFV